MLSILGWVFEKKYKSWFFVCCYFISAISGVLLFRLISDPAGLPVVGAAIPVAGILGTFIPLVKEIRRDYCKPCPAFVRYMLPVLFAAWLIINLSHKPEHIYAGLIASFLLGAAIMHILRETLFEDHLVRVRLSAVEKVLSQCNQKVLEARERIEMGEIKTAREILMELIRNIPDCIEAHSTLLDLYQMHFSARMNEIKDIGLRSIEVAAANDNKLLAVKAYYAFGDYLDKKRVLSLDAWFYMGSIMGSLQIWPEAINIYKRIIRDYSDDEASDTAYYVLGRIMARQNKRDEAIVIFKKLLVREGARNEYFYREKIEEVLQKEYGITVSEILDKLDQ